MDQALEIAAPGAVRLVQETGEHLDVAAGHEVLAGAAQHHGANRVVLLAARQAGGKRFGQGRIEGVEGIRPVERQRRDAVLDVEQYPIVDVSGHGGFLGCGIS